VPTDLLAWAFHSPRRLLGVVAGLLLALTLGVTGVAQAVGGGGGKAAAGSTSRAEATAAPSPDPAATSAAALEAYQPPAPDPDAATVARKFVKAWLKGPSAKTDKAWLDALHPYVTSELYAGLVETDPARIPPAKIAPGEVGALAVGDYLNELTVPLEGGRALAVTLAYDGAVWRVTSVEEAETKPPAKGP
jgi:hypothetical protein